MQNIWNCWVLCPAQLCGSSCFLHGRLRLPWYGPYELYQGFYLGCYDGYAYNVTTEDYYFATKVLKYYTETCDLGGACEFGYYDSYRTIEQSPTDRLELGCAPDCEKILYDAFHCLDYAAPNEYDYCRVWCYKYK